MHNIRKTTLKRLSSFKRCVEISPVCWAWGYCRHHGLAIVLAQFELVRVVHETLGLETETLVQMGRDETFMLKLQDRDTCRGRSRRDVPQNSEIITQVRSVTKETMNLVIYISIYHNLMILFRLTDRYHSRIKTDHYICVSLAKTKAVELNDGGKVELLIGNLAFNGKYKKLIVSIE